VIRPDFFDDATAVFPILIVTKFLVSRTHKLARWESWMHGLCLLVAGGGLVTALIAASQTDPQNWAGSAVSVMLIISGALLALDLMLAEWQRGDDQRRSR
jgi:hypothetical protein